MDLKRDLWIVLLTVGAIVYWSYQLTKETKQVDFKELYRLDSVRLLSRAFINSAKSVPFEIEYEDETRKLFKITGSTFSAIAPHLYEKLQYSNLVMTVLTDKNGYTNYFNNSDKNSIQVYNVIIDGVSYIDNQKINAAERKKKSTSIIVTFILYCIILVFYFYYRMKK